MDLKEWIIETVKREGNACVGCAELAYKLPCALIVDAETGEERKSTFNESVERFCTENRLQQAPDPVVSHTIIFRQRA